MLSPNRFRAAAACDGIRREPFGVVAHRRQTREGRSEADADFEQPRGRRRQAGEQQRRGAFLGRRDRLSRRFEEAVVHRDDVRAPLLALEDGEKDVQGKREVAKLGHTT